MALLVVHLGSNIGLRHRFLLTAKQLLATHVGIIRECSSTYETSAWGIEDQRDFLNLALVMDTNLSPLEALLQCQQIEKQLGRKRLQHWGSRTIDIDLIFYEQEIMLSEKLTLPHPQFRKRRFVLVPLHEIIPYWVDPQTGINIQELLNACTDYGSVVRVH